MNFRLFRHFCLLLLNLKYKTTGGRGGRKDIGCRMQYHKSLLCFQRSSWNTNIEGKVQDISLSICPYGHLSIPPGVYLPPVHWWQRYRYEVTLRSRWALTIWPARWKNPDITEANRNAARTSSANFANHQKQEWKIQPISYSRWTHTP